MAAGRAGRSPDRRPPDTGGRSSTPPVVRIAARVARALTLAYPAWFRRRHGRGLRQNVEDLLRDRHRADGAVGVLAVWPRLLIDLVAGGLAERLRRRTPTPSPDRASMLDSLLQDLRFAFRSLGSRPGLTLLAVATLALGIGASAAMFSVVDGVLLRPLPYPESERLMLVHQTIPSWQDNEVLGAFWDRTKWSFDDYEFWRQRQESFVAAAPVEDVTANLTGLGDADEIDVGLAGVGLFTMLGARPARGRFFVPEDEDREGRVAVLSHEFWELRLGGDPGAPGRTLTLDGDGYEIVGVLPPGFEVSGFRGDVWIPVFDDRPGGFFAGNTGDSRHVFRMIGRLREGVGRSRAQEETARVLAGLGGGEHFASSNYVDSGDAHGARVESWLAERTRSVRGPLWLLMGAVLLLLVVACVNVATFLLGRAMDRRAEIGMRAALGAGGGRIVRQLLTESLLLGLVGGVAGLLLAVAGIRGLVALAPDGIPRIDTVGLDLRATVLAIATAAIAGVLFGLAPALRLGRSDLGRGLAAGRFGSAGRSRLEAAFVAAEVALATLILVGAGLLTRSFLELDSVDPGFRVQGLVRVATAPNFDAFYDADGDFDDAAMRTWFGEVVAAIEAVPGVQGAAVAQPLPFDGWDGNNNVYPEGYEGTDADMLVADRRFVTPGYFEVMGIPLIEGRTLRPDDDRPDAASVVVINETAARRFWPGDRAVGKSLRFWEQTSEVVGVVGDVRDEALDEPPEIQFFAPPAVFGQAAGTIVARAEGDVTGTLTGAIERVVRTKAPSLPVLAVEPLEDRIAGSLDDARFRTRLIAVFAVVAALLSALGLYGVVARHVTGRRREIGIRMTLGARRPRVVRMVLGDGLRLTLGGALLGSATALLGARLLESFLYGVEPLDPVTFAGVLLLVIGMALAATLAPALRAASVHPMRVLRDG